MKFTTYIAPAVAALMVTAPVQANDNLSANEQELYWYAYAYGMVVDNCIHYDQGNISKNDIKLQLTVIHSLEQVTPYSKKAIREAINESARGNEMFRSCVPIVNGIWDQDEKVQSTVQTADYWN